LIITLILLSVVTFMAITFLALSRRERSAVSTVTDTAGARLAADAALANAEAQIMANVLSTTNPFNFTLLVSTNFINVAGYDPSVAGYDPTNVNYDHLLNSSVVLSQNQFLQNLANLLYSPRTPVYLSNIVTHVVENRFYLDLNRNGQFDANGWVPETNNLNQPTGFTNFMVGDPEWIGVLERPDAPYGPNNKFIARYAFIALPIGNTLDLNAIYNDAMRPDANMAGGNDGFLRNQGVGSWEINLAAFLTDLNTNRWDTIADPYSYREALVPNNVNIGAGFEDALALLKYRYGGANGTYNNLAWVQNLYSPLGQSAFQNNIDEYSDGPLMTTTAGINEGSQSVSQPWAGADNTNHFFNMQELFNPNESSIFFTNRLQSAGTNNSTYDRYTFYRLLSQLGTDSTPESGKMNLNYDNLVQTNAYGVASETNFYSWTAINFFTNAADRLLRAYTTQWRNSNPTNFATTFYTVTNFNFVNTDQWTNYPAFGLSGTPGGTLGIPVLVSNQFVYSPAVNRLLQLAANMYDATTNNTAVMGRNYPSIFRPLFSRDRGGLGTNVYITGYALQTIPITEGNEFNSPDLALPIDASVLAVTNIAGGVTNLAVNVYGVPWIIGAKKGFPNFNEFSLESAFQITRKLQYTRNTNTTPFQYASNQMYIMSITNFFGVECWNSYSNNYPGPVAILVRLTMAMNLTNDALGYSWPPPGTLNPAFYSTVATIPTSWPGYGTIGSSFVTPFGTNAFVIWLTNSVYNYGPNNMGYSPLPGFIPTSIDPSNYINSGTPPLPHFGLLTTNRLQVAIIDYSLGPNGRIIDYVQLNGMDRSRDLNAEIADPYDYDMWGTNLSANGTPMGVVNQVQYSRYGGSLPSEDSGEGNWASVPGFNPSTPNAEQFYFNHFFGHNLTVTYVDPITSRSYNATYTATNFQAPWTPTRTKVQRLTWQANDPLVHYITSDLTDTVDDTNAQSFVDWTNWPAILGQPNDRYMPWGGRPGSQINLNAADFNAANAWNMKLKDPRVFSSDFWDFPTNKFPTVGWLGRVHRGTPWQTVYLKAWDILRETNALGKYTGTNTWVTWTGNLNTNDAVNAAPAQDRLLFDLFTTAFNDNATRGTLSVNVGPTNANLAAWSALFSGIVVPTNIIVGNTIIQPAGPAGSSSLLGRLVTDINSTRATFTNSDGLAGTFEHLGDILATPELTVSNQWILLNNSDTINGISDEMYEWLPQQTMSLLRCSGSPRYVIYCYGQALKPAPNGIYTGSGQFFGMVTNYQVVSEIATRAVMRFGSTLTNFIGTNIVFNVNSGLWTTNWVGIPVVTNNNAVIESFNLLPPD
jgi:hypothetical protein